MIGILTLNILNKLVTLKLNNGLIDWKTEHQAVTGGIFYCRVSAGFSVSASNKLSCNLTVKCFEIGNKNIPPIRCMQGSVNELHRNNLIINLKKRIENISSLIEGWCKKKLVFAYPLLPFGTVREAHTHCTHLQITQTNPQTKICKRVQFLPTHTIIYLIKA
jgi:hypothetical protein